VNSGYLSEEITKTITAQLLVALKYMHQKLIAHRDLNLDNIMIHKDCDGDIQVKLIDFGSAIILNHRE